MNLYHTQHVITLVSNENAPFKIGCNKIWSMAEIFYTTSSKFKDILRLSETEVMFRSTLKALK